MFFTRKEINIPSPPIQIDTSNIDEYVITDHEIKFKLTDNLNILRSLSDDLQYKSNNDDTDEIQYNKEAGESAEVVEDLEGVEDFECEEDEYSEEDDTDCIYAISIDSIPLYYHKDIDTIRNNLDALVKRINLEDVDNINFINYKNDDEINIIRTLDFILFSFNFVLHTFKIHKLSPMS